MESFDFHQAIKHTPMNAQQIEQDFQNAFDALAYETMRLMKIQKQWNQQAELRKLEYESLMSKKEKLLSRLKNALLIHEQGRLWTHLTRITMEDSDLIHNRQGCHLDSRSKVLMLMDQERPVYPVIQNQSWKIHHPDAIVNVASSLDLAFDRLSTKAAIIEIKHTQIQEDQWTWQIDLKESIVSNWIELHLIGGLFGDVSVVTYEQNEKTQWMKQTIKPMMTWHEKKTRFDRIELTFTLRQPLFMDDTYVWILPIYELSFFEKQFYDEGNAVFGPLFQKSAAESFYLDGEGEHLDQIRFEMAITNGEPNEEDYQMIAFREPIARNEMRTELMVGTGTVKEEATSDFAIQLTKPIENRSNTKGFEVFYGMWQWKCEKTKLAFTNRQPTMNLWDYLWKQQPEQIRLYHVPIQQPISFRSNQDPVRDGNCFRFSTSVYCDEKIICEWKNPLYAIREQVLWTIQINQENILLQQAQYRLPLKEGWNELIILIHFKESNEDATFGLNELDLGLWLRPEIVDARAMLQPMRIKSAMEWEKETTESLRHSVLYSREKLYVRFKYEDVRFAVHLIGQPAIENQMLWLRARLEANENHDVSPVLRAIEWREIR